MSCMRCDACHALRWYGKQLQTVRVTDYPGPIERVYFICEICAEEHNIMLSVELPHPPTIHPPTMHPPHYRTQ